MTSQARAPVMHQLVDAELAALDSEARNYLLGGAESEATITRNRAAITRRALRPRVLRDVNDASLISSVLGRSIKMPLCLAPVGALDRFHKGGAKDAAFAAGRAGVPFVFGSLTDLPLGQMRASTTGPCWYQLYVRGDAEWLDQRVKDVAAAGFDALVLTVDSAVYSRRERDLALGKPKPYRAEFTDTAMRHQAALSWADVERLCALNAIPIILKGIATAQDAVRAAEIGVAAVYVSNHGGRQLDHGLGTLDMLEEIVAAVCGNTTIIVDGGFLRGTDIIKALALGADMVGLGRLYCAALAADGARGVTRMFELLHNELTTSLALLGFTSVDELTPAHIAVCPSGQSHPAFPHLDFKDDHGRNILF